MKKEYDLSKLESRKNPYATKLKKSITMRLSEELDSYNKCITSLGLLLDRLKFFLKQDKI
jgi:hypothetical protein